MFGLLELMTKRVNDQIAEYAVAQADIVRRLWGGWLDPFQVCRPVRIPVERRNAGKAPLHMPAQRHSRF